MLKKMLLICVLILGNSIAQEPPTTRGFGPQNMDAVRIWKLTEVLELSEDQVVTFLPLVQIHERKLREIQKEMVVLAKEGHKLMEAGEVSQKEVDKLIKKYSAKQDEVYQIKNDFLKSLPKHLTPKQQLLYLGFETRFRSELREYMKNERRSGTDQKYRSKRP
ncbi:MAG: hypothetical protein HQ508_01755 [Candidatus Marinimicrobia bacterium]|nr:hypothetical protein [Candidatus Neomarinimicrobiota bacterium]